MRLTYVLFIALFALVLSACEKNSPTDELINLQEQRKSNEYSSMTAAETEAHILSLIELINYQGDADLRDATIYTDDETVWNIESTLNYTYADVENPFGDHDVLIDTIALSRAAYDTVTETEFTTLYDEVLEKVSDYYHSISDTGKAPLIFDIYHVSSSSSELEVGVRFVTGLPVSCGNLLYPYVDADGDFNAMTYVSACSECFAPESLAKSLNENLPSGMAKTVYFTDLFTFITYGENWTVYAYPSGFNTSNISGFADNYELKCVKEYTPSQTGCDSTAINEYGLCENIDTDDIRCVEYGEMNDYYLDMEDYYDQYFTNNSAWSFVNTEILPAEIIGPGCFTSEWWSCDFTIGKKLTRAEAILTELPDSP